MTNFRTMRERRILMLNFINNQKSRSAEAEAGRP